MNEPILKAVAMPPRLFWAPLVPAVLNLGVQFGLLFMLLAFYQFNPLWMIFLSLFPTHLLLIALGTKEPHLSNMLKAQGPFMKKSHSIYPQRGKKLAP